jgi:hypothetical protein
MSIIDGLDLLEIYLDLVDVLAYYLGDQFQHRTKYPSVYRLALFCSFPSLSVGILSDSLSGSPQREARNPVVRLTKSQERTNFLLR